MFIPADFPGMSGWVFTSAHTNTPGTSKSGWTNADGTPVPESIWNSTQPRNEYPAEQCGIVLPSPHDALYDYDCSNSMSIICETTVKDVSFERNEE